VIDFYTFSTPNGRKVAIMLEELGLRYDVHVVNISAGEQFAPEFLDINPNAKIPAIVDREGPNGMPIKLFESGAILFYLAEKTQRLLAPHDHARYATLQWLMFQMSAIGPMLGQFFHFANVAKDKIPYAIERYRQEAKRLLGVMDKRLSEQPYLSGEYSIADIATYPWIAGMREFAPELWNEYEHLIKWIKVVGERPAVVRGMKVPESTS